VATPLPSGARALENTPSPTQTAKQSSGLDTPIAKTGEYDEIAGQAGAKAHEDGAAAPNESPKKAARKAKAKAKAGAAEAEGPPKKAAGKAQAKAEAGAAEAEGPPENAAAEATAKAEAGAAEPEGPPKKAAGKATAKAKAGAAKSEGPPKKAAGKVKAGGTAPEEAPEEVDKRSAIGFKSSKSKQSVPVGFRTSSKEFAGIQTSKITCRGAPGSLGRDPGRPLRNPAKAYRCRCFCLSMHRRRLPASHCDRM
jgi:membrane protein involved in colicin uptake